MSEPPREGIATSSGRLRWSGERIAAALDEQISDGRSLLPHTEPTKETVVAKPVVDRSVVEEEYAKWHVRNREILREAFTVPTELFRYDGSAQGLESVDSHTLATWDQQQDDELAPTRHQLRAQLDWLSSLRGRIDYYVATTVVDHPAQGTSLVRTSAPPDGQLFVVHGHDHGARDSVARVLQRLTGREPTILSEQVDGGSTVIEKFEVHAGQSSAAVVILSPDDEGRARSGNEKSMRPRARQNVVYELGWFHGRLGRGRVVAIMVDDVEQPSDVGGVLYIRKDPNGSWMTALGKELRAMGIAADLNQL